MILVLSKLDDTYLSAKIKTCKDELSTDFHDDKLPLHNSTYSSFENTY